MKRRFFPALIMLIVAAVGTSSKAQPATARHRVRPQRQYQNTSTKATNVIPGTYLSPDGAYKLVATKPTELAEVAYKSLSIVPVKALAGKPEKKLVIHANGAQSHLEKFLWLPRHPHALVVLRKASAGASSIELWNGGSGFQVLFKGSTTDSEDGDAEFLNLQGVSQEGTHVYYSYIKFHTDKNGNVKEKVDPQKLPVRSLTVPR